MARHTTKPILTQNIGCRIAATADPDLDHRLLAQKKAMKQNGMAKETMSRDAMSKDSMSKDGMGNDGMSGSK